MDYEQIDIFKRIADFKEAADKCRMVMSKKETKVVWDLCCEMDKRTLDWGFVEVIGTHKYYGDE